MFMVNVTNTNAAAKITKGAPAITVRQLRAATLSTFALWPATCGSNKISNESHIAPVKTATLRINVAPPTMIRRRCPLAKPAKVSNSKAASPKNTGCDTLAM